MERPDLTYELKRRAGELGFSFCGVCPAIAPAGAQRLDEWLAAGYAGEMNYIADRREAYCDPNRVLDGVRSIIMLAMNYRTADPATTRERQGRVSRYAWGDADYHDLIRERLNALRDFLEQSVPGALARGVVDSAPLMEREFAEFAGLGWIGKNTLLINRQAGSWFFLAALLTDLELSYDTSRETDHCGNCRACLDACPTRAFAQPYVLDASRCISYLTIELRGPIARDLRPGVGDWLFGCDVCQDVCPWNSRAPLSRQAEFGPREDSNPIELIALFELDDAAFRARFRHTPLWRPRRRGLLRNAAIVLGNRPTTVAIPALICGLKDHEPLVRGACAWALGRYTDREARYALESQRGTEIDIYVLDEIDAALRATIDPLEHDGAESTS